MTNDFPGADPHDSYSIRPQLRMAAILCGGVLGGLTLWACLVPLDSAVIGSGTVHVEGAVKSVQHPDGGVVASLPVVDGQQVAAGEVVLRLDQTALMADLSASRTRLTEVEARRARLLAERDGAALVFPAALTALLDDPALAMTARDAMDDERVLMEGRAEANRARISQLQERIGQLGNEAQGLIAQKDAADRSARLVAEDLVDVNLLESRALVPRSRASALERGAADLDGTRGALIAQMAQAEGKATELRMQILQIEQETKGAIIQELRELEAERGELIRRTIAAEDKLARTTLVAPVTGRVHELAVHTLGGVLGAGETAMAIVPADSALTIEVRIAPADIDQVHVGQQARLRLSAFNQHQTPEIIGSFTHISADLSHDPQTGVSWYLLRVAPDVAQLQGIDLKPGMPAEVFLLGTRRTLMSYLLKPVSDQMSSALREN